MPTNPLEAQKELIIRAQPEDNCTFVSDRRTRKFAQAIIMTHPEMENYIKSLLAWIEENAHLNFPLSELRKLHLVFESLHWGKSDFKDFLIVEPVVNQKTRLTYFLLFVNVLQ
jgi:hypothetical protein